MPTEFDPPAEPLPIVPRGPVDIVVRPPGSKSQTNRALICASLSPGNSRLIAPLVSDDSRAMRRCLAALGISIGDGDGVWTIAGAGGQLAAGPPVILDAAASGTTVRFVTGLAALAPRTVTIDGTARMRERPIGPLVESLKQAGVDIDDHDGFPPVTIRGGAIRGGHVTIDASGSSQFLSGLLMAAPLAQEPMSITVEGLASAGYVTTTIEVMAHFGIEVVPTDGRFVIPASSYRAADLTIEADASAAVYPWAAAAITGGRAAVEGIPAHSTQPDLGMLEVLAAMGCAVNGHTVVGSAELAPVDLDLSHMPDGAMTVAVLCAVAAGKSRLRGLATLRSKETDRLGALVSELARVGVPAVVEGDSLEVEGGGRLAGATIETYDDHRMAMAFSLLGLVVDGISIADPACVSKTWPAFFEEQSTW